MTWICPHPPSELESQEQVAPGLLRCRACGHAGYLLPSTRFLTLEELEQLSEEDAEQVVRDNAQLLRRHH